MTSVPFRIGLLGHGTVGGAFAALVADRADEVQRLTGRRPEISGVLTRSRGTADEVIGGADLIVEVMGGLDPTLELVTGALRAGRPVVSREKFRFDDGMCTDVLASQGRVRQAAFSGTANGARIRADVAAVAAGTFRIKSRCLAGLP